MTAFRRWGTAGSRPWQVNAHGMLQCWCARPGHELSIRSSRTMVVFRVESGAVTAQVLRIPGSPGARGWRECGGNDNAGRAAKK